jgi:hypothetical protein
MKRTLALLALALAVPLPAQQGAAPFTIVESGQTFHRLDDAVKAVGDRDATIRIAPGRYRDCATQEAGRIAYVAAQAGTAIFDGGVCDGKATLVLRGRDAVVDGLIFQNMRVPDGNGAGIRLEKGPLSVANTIFRDSESGILGGNDEGSAIRVERSTFAGLGRCDRDLDCAHSIYIGRYGSLSVAHSRFERGRGGHYVKSRAARIEVVDSSFDDTKGHTTNYMIDLSAGATGTIARNVFVQGPDKENHSAFITVAPESRDNRSAGLIVDANQATLAPEVSWSTVFLADWSHEPLKLGKNALGSGIRPFEIR